MAYNKDQQESPLPVNGVEEKRTSVDFLPKYFRTQANKKLLSSTLDQLIQPGVAEKVSGYFGRTTAKSFRASDTYVEDVSEQRQNRQLEPATVVKDDLGNVNFYGDYTDFVNQITNFNGSATNQSRLNSQEYYAWNPNIDWDKFVNFREYYWMPNGPQTVSVFGQSKEVQTTYTVTVEDQDDNTVYKFSPPGFEPNPSLRLFRGQTYRFEINTPGHPFSFSTNLNFADTPAEVKQTDSGFWIVSTIGGGENESSLYVQNMRAYDLDGNEIAPINVEEGVIEFEVALEAPDRLYYASQNSINTSGLVKIMNIESNTAIDVNEIIGAKTYKSANEVTFTNGLKVKFQGEVTPGIYADDEWYVEGVGDKIRLVKESDLTIPASYSEDVPVPFDSQGFDRLPFGNANSYAGTKDYIVINRASLDRNPWTRYNRWFHKDVIEASATYNNQIATLDQDFRASRPIIEFEAGLKLHNFGTQAKKDVDLIDTVTVDAFSTVEGSTGYNVDGIDLADGMRIIFAAETDILVRAKVYEVKFLLHNSVRKISLIEAEDAEPQENETVIVRNGNTLAGKLYWYNGTTWAQGQQKDDTNQPPLFDMFDSEGNSYSDKTAYDTTSFAGNKVFAYIESEVEAVDTELGFGLTYRSIENLGDISFEFPLITDTFSYQVDNDLVEVKTETGYLRKYQDLTNYVSQNGWTKARNHSSQAVIRQYVVDTQFNDFAVDVFDKSGDLNDLRVKVVLNNRVLTEDVEYAINRLNGVAYIRFTTDLSVDDNLVLKCYSATDKNENGYYEIAHNLERNPLNTNMGVFTLGEVIDHVGTITEETPDYNGNPYPGSSNLRDLGNLDSYGKRFVKHTGPVNLALYHLVNKEANIIKSLRFARAEYAKFKRQFIQTAETLGYDGPIKQHVDLILKTINAQKTDRMPFYFTDMVPTGGAKRIEHEVKASDGNFFAMSAPFSLSEHTAKAVLVYLNGVQLTHGKDYTFNGEGFVEVTAEKQFRDIIEIYEYDTTDGCFVPSTPSKLGLYPKYEPQKYVDNTTLESRTVIQGHDGSIVLAYNDFRDELLLELERRIFNNIKQEYNTDIVDIHEFVGGNYRNTGFTKTSIDRSAVADFVQWAEIAGNPDYTDNSFYTTSNSFTYNYKFMSSPTGSALPGYWRGVYKDAYDTDRPHTHPWEMLGFTIQPSWWADVYGPAPYTSANLVLWEDLQDGVIREPGVPVRRNKKYARAGLLSHIPVNDQGQLLSPLESGYAQNFIQSDTSNEFAYGDESPVESAWRKSSEYPFALITAWVLNQPTKIIGLGFDLSRMERNPVGNVVYKESGVVLRLEDLVFPNTVQDNERVITSGLVNYVYNYMASSTTASYETYQENIKSINNQLAIKVGGFTEKTKFKLILDSRTPLNEGNVFVPEENYQIFLNTSAPIATVSYSGIIVEKSAAGFIIKGYDKQASEFTYYEPIQKSNDPVINVGGVSEEYVDWNERKQYVKGQNVRYNGVYYRVSNSHVSSTDFDLNNFAKLASLPQAGGRDAVLRRQFTKRTLTLPYGTLIRTVQEVVDFLLGYQEWLKDQGVVFEYFNEETNQIEDWNFSAKEFLFWTTQNWAAGSVLALSPGAQEMRFSREYAVVDDIFDNFYDYTLLKSDGKKLERSFSSIARDSENDFGLSTKNTADGIYSIRLPLVQKEHVVLLDNKTVFNDYIYDPEAGYRQERIRVTGYRSDGWTGGLNIPGFVYDSAEVTDWAPWKDYGIGSLVKYKEFYYVAIGNLTGVENFNSADWERLDERPTAKMYPNFDYRINQFADFYDLDSDNFDVEQQKHAQHLIGYQKRQYLQNIINDEVSQYKFYQGMIQDKGTANALTKLFDALSSADKDSLEFYEEWAVRVGRYGATDNFEEVEYIIDEKELKLDPQPIELVDSIPLNDVDLTYKLTRGDVYSAPVDYDHAPFPVTLEPQNVTRSSGYVTESDVRYRIDDKYDLLGRDLSALGPDDYVWVTGRNSDWDVLQLVTTKYRVTKIETFQQSVDSITGSDTPGAIFHLDRTAEDFSINDVIGLSNVEVANQGFFEIIGIANNRIEVLVPEEQSLKATEDDETINGYIAVLRSVRAKAQTDLSPVESANLSLEGNLLDDQRVWIDGVVESDWKVLQKSKSFEEFKEIVNPSTATSNDVQFGQVIATNRANTVLAVSDPTNDNGKVNTYARPSISTEFKLIETLEPNLEFDSFGSSIALSEDGNILVVGSPNATNIQTNFVGDYSKTSNFVQNAIVKHAENYWRAVRDVPAENSAVTFTTFDSYAFREKENDSSEMHLLLQGSPYLANQETDHLLIKAPIDQFRGTKPGDKLVLNWNLYTNFNRIEGDTTAVQPFPDNINTANTGPYRAPNADFIEGEHVIVEKIDQVILLIEYANPPVEGDVVSTSSGRGTVYKVFKKDFSMVLYIKDINGEFVKDSQLFRNEQLVGTYTTPHYNTASETDGWWYIDTDDTYFTSNEFTDLIDFASPGYGLVYQDVFTLNEDGTTYARTTPNYYYNSLDSVQAFGAQSEAAFITTLSHIGDAHESATKEFLDSRWLMRLPKGLESQIAVDDYVNVWVDDDADPIDELLTGIDAIIINREPTGSNEGAHRIREFWDGYIDFRHTNTQSVDYDEDGVTSDFYEPRIGDIVEDGLTGATGEVAYYIKRNVADARVYLKNVTGEFTLLDNIRLQTYEISGIRTDSQGPATFNKRTMGQIRKISLATATVGKLAVFDENPTSTFDSNGYPIYSGGTFQFPANPNSYGADPAFTNLNTFAYVNKEYWIYQEERNEVGAELPASIPSTSNRDWQIVYNIPVVEDGLTTYGLPKGAYSVYRRAGPSWQFINTYTLPTSELKVGKTVDVTQDGSLYRIYVGTQDRVHFIKTGFDADDNLVSYALDIDPNYRGVYSADNLYRLNELVLFRENNNFVNQPILETDAISSALIVNPTSNLGLNDRIVFSGTAIGGLELSTDYYVKSILNSTRFTVSLTPGGDTVPVTNGIGNMYASVPYDVYKSLTFNDGVSPANKLKWQLITEEVANSHYVPIDANIYSDTLFDAVDTLIDFSADVAVSARGHVFATAIKTSQDVDADNKIVVYRLNEQGRYVWSQTIVAPANDTGWASSIDMSSDGKILVVGDPGNDTDGNDNGRVFVYKMNAAQQPQFELTQTLQSPRTDKFEKFGTQVSITDNWIAVSSFNGDISIRTTLDSVSSTNNVSELVGQNTGIKLQDILPTLIRYYDDGIDLLELKERTVNDDTLVDPDYNSNWIIYTTLNIGDLVKYEEKTYRCLTEYLAEDIPAVWNPLNFTEIDPVPVYRNINLEKDKLIEYNNETYKVLQDTTYPSGFDISNTSLFEVALPADIYTNYINNNGEVNNTKTTFDRDFTSFSKRTTDSGSITLYQQVDGDYLIAEELEHPRVTDAMIGDAVVVNGNEVYVGAPRLSSDGGVKGAVINYGMPRDEFTWEVLRSSTDVVDINKIKQAFLYNIKTNQLVTYLDYVDVQQGKIPGPADQEITFKSYNDLARYNVTLNRRQFSEYNNWENEHVGKLWWDLSTARFKNAYQGDAINQLNRWNTIVPGYEIDVYEWVESDIIPSEWDEIADTPKGFAQGYSGTSRYSDDAYSQKLVYDPVAKNFGTKYYFWVKNKATIPAIDGRTLSAKDVASLIQDPAGQGYKYLALLSNRRFALVNCKTLIADTDVALNVAYYTQDNQEQNVHTEYQIISEGLETSQPKADVERKWLDSLVGYDTSGSPVPDPKLPPRQKYGNLTTPRQGWFVNRQEALKQTIERANLVLSQNIMVDEYSFDRLNSQEAQPLATTFTYDYAIDTIDELRFVGTVKAEPAQIDLDIRNGQLAKATITNKGRSYVDPTYVQGESTRRRGPSYTVIGAGEDLELDLTINNLGQVTKVDIVNAGTNYTENTQIVVRKLSVLVRNDETVGGRWAVYEWDNIQGNWNRKRVQSYNTTLYWDYADWYATGYNQFTTIDYSVDFSYQLAAVDSRIGDIVKIQSIGSGGWLLLRKVADTGSRDYTEDYETIGRENGTIQFSSRLYDVAVSNVGFDAFAYDSKFFDSEPVAETRQILEAIKEDLFVDDLAKDYNELFFASVRYVLSEQFNADWVFKTSFVKAKHNVGELEQKITYQNDNLPSYNDYIEEVKPYKTNIREYLSAYERIENTNTLTSDFDVPPFYDETQGKIVTSNLKVIDNTLVGLEPRFDEYPDKNWLDTVGFEVTQIAIADAGFGYTNPPQVFIEGGGGTGATAKAYIGRRRVVSVEVTNPGSGYLSAPTVRLVGDVADGGTEARLTAVIGNSLAKSFKVITKFDRVSGEYFIVSLPETQVFAGTAQQTVFDLRWPMELKTNKVIVTVDGEKQLRSKYTFTNVEDNTKSYTRQLGQIQFVEPPALDAQIVVEYHKDPAMLQSADRIREFYKPVAGMPGVDLGQLMDGVDYGGVEVRSFDFDGPAGWDTDGWYSEPWDTYDNTYEDILFVSDGTTVVIDLDQPLEDGIVYNIYKNGVRIDDENYDTNPANPSAVMQSITGDGVTTIVNLADVESEEGDRFIVRKNTSDGAFLPDGDSFDTLLEGGNLSYGNASGVNAEDIIVDGDLFVTPISSGGPEELVPGQILDTVDIKVYERYGQGQGEVYNQNYITDGVATEFDLGLFPNSDDAVIVKLGTDVLTDSDYTVDRVAQTLTFNTAPTAGQRLTILSVGQNGKNILDINTIIADGTTTILETKVVWTKDLQYVITVNGETPEAGTVIPTNNDAGFVVFEFATGNPPAGTQLDYEIYSNEDQQNYSKISKDTFVADGSTVSYNLAVAPQYKGPAQYYTIVEVDGTIQSPGYNIQYVIDDAQQREYELEKFQVPNSSINTAFLEVYVNDRLLDQGGEYLVNIGNSSIILDAGLVELGDELEIYLRDTGEYEIDGNTLTFNTAPAEDAVINVYSFTNHDVTGLERYTYDVVARSSLTQGSSDFTKYHNLTGGKIELASPAVGVQYVWVMVGGEWLMPTVDYELSLDKRIVYLKDTPAAGVTVDVLHFAAPVSTPRIAWRQFKDILNRNIYKRVDNAQGIVLAQDLNDYDLRIEVEDSSLLPNPDRRQNKPGIIFVNGERIEYFVKDGNTLRQLRRGTLGTGVGNVYPAGTAIEAQGSDKTIPYADQVITTNYDATQGQTRITLDWIPAAGANEFELFVAGRRLRKTELAVFDPTIDLDSPEGDVIQPAEFTVELTYNELGQSVLAEAVLTEAASEGQRITIVRKLGKLWSDPGTPLKDAQNDIGNFLRQSISELPE